MSMNDGSHLGLIYALLRPHVAKRHILALTDKVLSSVSSSRLFELPAIDFISRLVDAAVQGYEPAIDKVCCD